MPVAERTRLAFADNPLAWSYSTTANRYRAPDGKFIGAEQVRNLRDTFLDVRMQNVRGLAASLGSDAMSLPEWETAMRQEIKLTHGVEYVFGRGGLDQMTSDDLTHLGSLVTDQYKFLNAFANDISTGTMSEAEIGARSELYIGTATGAYERGAAMASGDPSLRQYPGDGQTPCGGRCRCSLLIETNATGWLVYWIAAASRACRGCREMAGTWAPLVVPYA